MAVATRHKRQRTSLLILNVEVRGKYIPSYLRSFGKHVSEYYLIASFARFVAL